MRIGDDQRACLDRRRPVLLDVGSHGAKVDRLGVDRDLAVLVDDDCFSSVLAHRADGARPAYLDARLLDEDCRDDEEDEQVDREVEHRCEIDAVGTFDGVCVGQYSHGRNPQYIPIRGIVGLVQAPDQRRGLAS